MAEEKYFPRIPTVPVYWPLVFQFCPDPRAYFFLKLVQGCLAMYKPDMLVDYSEENWLLQICWCRKDAKQNCALYSTHTAARGGGFEKNQANEMGRGGCRRAPSKTGHVMDTSKFRKRTVSDISRTKGWDASKIMGKLKLAGDWCSRSRGKHLLAVQNCYWKN